MGEGRRGIRAAVGGSGQEVVGTNSCLDVDFGRGNREAWDLGCCVCSK